MCNNLIHNKGVGFGKKNAGKMRHKWGLNLLGKALMDVRKTLREQQETAGKACS